MDLKNERPLAGSEEARVSIGPDANALSTIIPLNSMASGVPPAAVLRLLARHSREHLSGFITVAIDLLDLACGDADLEITDAEDDFTDRPARPWHGPGCPIADAAEEDDEDGEHDGREPERVI